MQSTQERFTALYAAFDARDIEAVLAALDPDVDWPNGLEGGRVHGHEAVALYWARQWELIDPHVEPVRIREDGAERVVVDVYQVVQDMSGALLTDHMVQHIYTVRDGRVVHMEIRQMTG